MGLVLFSSSVALLLYVKQEKKPQEQMQTVEVYVSAKNIKRGTLLKITDIVKAKLPKSYLAFTPLTANEIIGRYAKVDMFAKEPIRPEKLSIAQPKERTVVVSSKKEVLKKEQKVEFAQYDDSKDTITMPLSIFTNLDLSLKAGDFIDIVTIIPTKSRKFKTKYVAVHISINAFVMGTSKVEKPYSVTKEGATVYANAVVLDILPGDIKNLLATYYDSRSLNASSIYNPKKENKGHLWMIKCTNELNPTIQKYKKKMMVNRVISYKKPAVRRERVSISYED